MNNHMDTGKYERIQACVNEFPKRKLFLVEQIQLNETLGQRLNRDLKELIEENQINTNELMRLASNDPGILHIANTDSTLCGKV